MPVESNTLFGDDGIGDALNWVGNQFFIDSWSANPSDTTLENFDITGILMDFGSKWEELQNCDTIDEAKNKMIQDIVSSVLEHFNIDDAEKLEQFLMQIDSEGNIEESLQNLSQFVEFEMVEGHEGNSSSGRCRWFDSSSVGYQLSFLTFCWGSYCLQQTCVCPLALRHG